MTSANVTIYVIRNAQGKVVGEHRQHSYCKANWEKLLRFQPLEDHTIQWTWLDEKEAYHEEAPQPLSQFLGDIAEREEDIESRYKGIKTKREMLGLPPPRERYLGVGYVPPPVNHTLFKVSFTDEQWAALHVQPPRWDLDPPQRDAFEDRYNYALDARRYANRVIADNKGKPS